MGIPGLNVQEQGGELWFALDPDPKPFHFALAASDQEQVRSFHRAAIEAGGVDNGAPG